MAFNLRNRHFLKLLDFSPEEIGFLLDLSMKNSLLFGRSNYLLQITHQIIIYLAKTKVFSDES